MRAETLWPPVLHPPFPFKLPPTKPFDPALVVDMRLHEGVGNIARDLSQFKNHGTIYGALWTTGKHGFALDFDDVDDYVYIAPSPSLHGDFFQSDFTLAMWIKWPGTGVTWQTLWKSLPVGA